MIEEPHISPFEVYQARHAHWQAEEAASNKLFIRLGNWRLFVAVAAAIAAWLIWGRHSLAPWWLLVPALAFILLVIKHQQVIRRQTRAKRAVAYYRQARERLQDRWSGQGATGDQFRGNDDHVYANDLDLFGTGSLFQMVSRARTAAGEQRLADWLLRPAVCDEVLVRQSTVKELSGRVDLREDIMLLGEDIRSNVDEQKVIRWAERPVSDLRLIRAIAFLLSLLGVCSLAAFFASLIPLWLFAIVLGLNFLFSFLVRSRIAAIVHSVETPAQDLGLVSLLLARLERETFQSERAQRLSELLKVAGNPASARIRRLERWIELLDSGDHLLVRVLQPLLLWREQTALGAEHWRAENRLFVGNWLSAIAEFEALSSLAALAFERPDWTFPALVRGDQAWFSAQAIRHPLIPADRCVPNDIGFQSPLRLFIISGSNMSGKSTLLRAIGLNTALSLAGAPVAAEHLELSELQVGASLRVSDSLQDNRSRFMAEITRLREIVLLSHRRPPVLFLLDELLSGTNSHDRRIGAASIVKGLVDSGAIGLVTTHDLALADIQKDLGERAANAHFQDEIVNGQIEFDYRLHPGVVTRSNALELMRAIGLTV